jgi:hypothetical protein
MFQIMGYHWELLGYDSVSQFVDAMHESEANHLDAAVRFILAQPEMHSALKQKEWAEFAYRYNGPAYHRNLYDVKLQRAYEESLEAFPESEAKTPEKAKPAPKRKSSRKPRGQK